MRRHDEFFRRFDRPRVEQAGSATGTVQPSPTGSSGWRMRQFALPGGAISIVFVMLVPLPALVLDLLLACRWRQRCWCFSRRYRCARPSIFRSFPPCCCCSRCFGFR